MSALVDRLVRAGLLVRSQLGGCTKIHGLDWGHGGLIKSLLDHFQKVRPPYDNMWLEGSFYACMVTVVQDTVSFLPFISGANGDCFRGVVRTVSFDAIGAANEDPIPEFRIPVGHKYIPDLPVYWPVDKHNQDRTARELLLDSMHLLLVVATTIATISLLHCKNVTLDDEPANRSKRRQLQREGLGGLVYKVLKIRGFGATPVRTNRESGEESTVSLTRLHLVRGHFATWTAERPLFGKYVGTWWVNAHAKGQANHGAVAKAYQVGEGAC